MGSTTLKKSMLRSSCKLTLPSPWRSKSQLIPLASFSPKLKATSSHTSSGPPSSSSTSFRITMKASARALQSLLQIVRTFYKFGDPQEWEHQNGKDLVSHTIPMSSRLLRTRTSRSTATLPLRRECSPSIVAWTFHRDIRLFSALFTPSSPYRRTQLARNSSRGTMQLALSLVSFYASQKRSTTSRSCQCSCPPCLFEMITSRTCRASERISTSSTAPTVIMPYFNQLLPA